MEQTVFTSASHDRPPSSVTVARDVTEERRERKLGKLMSERVRARGTESGRDGDVKDFPS